MTPAWGKCCTQFFMHNGRKRASAAAGVGGAGAGVEAPSSLVSKLRASLGGDTVGTTAPEKVIESIIEYIRLKSKVSNVRFFRCSNFPAWRLSQGQRNYDALYEVCFLFDRSNAMKRNRRVMPTKF